MSEVTMSTRPDTSDMVRAHAVIRQAFAGVPQLLGAVAADDADQVARIATYYEGVLLFIRIHHEGEDELLWPRLRERCPGVASVIEHAAEQHEQLLDHLVSAESLLDAWRDGPTVDRAAALAAGLAVLGANLVAHLDDEERTILPLVEKHLTVEEWDQLPAHGALQWRRRGPQLRWLVMGLLREQQSPALRAEIEARWPDAVREYWNGEGEPQYREFVTRLGAASPRTVSVDPDSLSARRPI